MKSTAKRANKSNYVHAQCVWRSKGGPAGVCLGHGTGCGTGCGAGFGAGCKAKCRAPSWTIFNILLGGRAEPTTLPHPNKCNPTSPSHDFPLLSPPPTLPPQGGPSGGDSLVRLYVDSTATAGRLGYCRSFLIRRSKERLNGASTWASKSLIPYSRTTMSVWVRGLNGTWEV